MRSDVLFSALGTTLKQAGGKEDQDRIDYTYQYEAAAAAARNGVSQYVLVSSSGANPKSGIFYPRMKGELEDAVGVLKAYRPIEGATVAQAMVQAAIEAAPGIHVHALGEIFAVAGAN